MTESIRKLQTSSLAVQNYHATFTDGLISSKKVIIPKYYCVQILIYH